jgi:hypothetical protein
MAVFTRRHVLQSQQARTISIRYACGYGTTVDGTDYIIFSFQIKYLVDRLSAMEAEQQKTARLMERLEVRTHDCARSPTFMSLTLSTGTMTQKENHDLRVTVKVMAEKSAGVIPPALEESVIAQLEASVAKLGKQIEDLERERNSRTKC